MRASSSSAPGAGGRRLLSARTPPNRVVPTLSSIARRRWLVVWTKRLLPLAALGLLSLIALWPEIDKVQDQSRVTFRRVSGDTGNGAMVTDARYRSVDDRGRPYTVTAATATQVGSDRVNMTKPMGDVTLQSGSWLMLQAHRGVYMRHLGQLDLQGDVTLYRDDGTTLHSPTATIDLNQGAAASNSQVHAEGPFGTLDAQGFALVDKGQVIQFTGPARMVLNGGNS